MLLTYALISNAHSPKYAGSLAAQSHASTEHAEHGPADSTGPGMSLRSGQVKPGGAPISVHAPSPSLDDDSDAEAASATRKRRRRNKAVLDDYEYAQLSDPEERKLEKRRAKNRRTARVSRERKQAELSAMKEQLANQSKEIQQLKEMIQQRDKQISQLKGLTSPDMGAPLGAAYVGLQKASESAVLNSCTCSYSMQAKRTDLQPTVPPRATTCLPRLNGDCACQAAELKSLRPVSVCAEVEPDAGVDGVELKRDAD